MKLPANLTVTDQSIDISGLSEPQITYYQDVARRLTEYYRKNGKGRQVFTLSGPAGSGKSVITALLEHLFSEQEEFHYVNLGLDAFHIPNAVLAERKLLDVKGRYDTYDVDLLHEKLTRFLAGETVAFPYYSREDHNPLPDRILVTETNVLLILEGQWLLRKESSWERVRSLSSYNLAVSGPAEALRDNVIRRHMRGGRTMEDAMNFYLTSDHENMREVLLHSAEPDERLLFYKDIS